MFWLFRKLLIFLIIFGILKFSDDSEFFNICEFLRNSQVSDNSKFSDNSEFLVYAEPFDNLELSFTFDINISKYNILITDQQHCKDLIYNMMNMVIYSVNVKWSGFFPNFAIFFQTGYCTDVHQNVIILSFYQYIIIWKNSTQYI